MSSDLWNEIPAEKQERMRKYQVRFSKTIFGTYDFSYCDEDGERIGTHTTKEGVLDFVNFADDGMLEEWHIAYEE